MKSPRAKIRRSVVLLFSVAMCLTLASTCASSPELTQSVNESVESFGHFIWRQKWLVAAFVGGLIGAFYKDALVSALHLPTNSKTASTDE